eukprot:scaffold1201_cov125-Isochrysis_galbana.AAC.6
MLARCAAAGVLGYCDCDCGSRGHMKQDTRHKQQKRRTSAPDLIHSLALLLLTPSAARRGIPPPPSQEVQKQNGSATPYTSPPRSTEYGGAAMDA